jgi:hypothetical protein
MLGLAKRLQAKILQASSSEVHGLLDAMIRTMHTAGELTGPLS